MEIDVQGSGFELVGDGEHVDEAGGHAMEEVEGGDIEDLGFAHEDDASLDGAAWVGEVQRHGEQLMVDEC